MREVNVIPGLAYAVTATNDCSVLLPSGVPMLSIAAGTQDIVVAQAGKLLVSDDAALVTEVRNPKWLAERNPKWLAELRTELDGLLDGSAYELAWMPKGEKLVVHTDRLDDAMLEQVRATAEAYLPAGVELVQYNHHIEVSWRDYFKYQDCVYISDLKKVNPDYKNDVTSGGLWCYSLPKFKQSAITWGDALFSNSKVRRVHLDLPAMNDCGSITMYAKELEEIRFNFPKVKSLVNLCPSTPKLKSVEIIAPQATNIKDMCGNQWWPSGAVQHVRLYTPLVSYGLRAFYMCELDVASVLNIVGMIPSWDSDPDSHILDFGIHIDHKQDPDVLAALAHAEEKGWKITVRWNGTPTSTASVMRFGQLIYAKVGEMEMPDGTTEKYLDWAHYVTDETGYETFRSLESAYEYFGLPMPEEESQPTE